MKRSLAVIGCLLASQSQAVQLTGNFIPQNQYAQTCDPYAVPMDFMYSNTWGKRAVPRNCATVTPRNPVFAWNQPNGTNAGHPTTLTVTSEAKKADGTPVYTRSITTTTPRMIFPEQLASGKYTWQVSYELNGATVKSSLRRFYVAGTYALPTADEVHAIVASKPRPRSVREGFTHAQVRALAVAQGSELKPAFESAELEAGYYQQGVMANGRDYTFSSPPTMQDSDTVRGKTSGKERKAIETLGHMYLFTGNLEYLKAARKRLLSLAAWDYEPGSPTSEEKQDQANREVILALAIGLDIFASPAVPAEQKLNDTERKAIVANLKSRIQQSRDSIGELDRHPYGGHQLTVPHFLTEALMLAQGTEDFPEADEWLKDSWNALITTTGTWGGVHDGGYGNGTTYGWVTANIYSRTLAAMRLITGHDLTRFEPFGGIGNNLIAQTPPGNQPLMGIFGDDTENRSQFWDYAGNEFRLYAHTTGKPEYEWYWRTLPGFVTRNWAQSPYHFLMLAYRTPAAPATEPVLPNSFKFEDAGYVAFHSNTKDPKRSSLFFRSSPLGSENHSHADNNSFNFVSKGKEIFISSGLYGAYGSDHHNLWTRHTKAKNALTFDGGIGQSMRVDKPEYIVQSTDASGKLVNFYDDGNWKIATGEAGKSYRMYDLATGWGQPMLRDAYRTVAYRPADGVAIIYDYARSDTARIWELNFHTLVEPVLGSGTMKITRTDPAGDVNVCTTILAPASQFMTSSQIAVTDPQSEISGSNPQFHTRYKTVNARNEFASVTVIRENCASAPVATALTGTAMKVEINGRSITFDKQTVSFD